MKKIIYCLVLISIFSCSADEMGEEDGNIIEISYRGYYEVITNDYYKRITFPFVNVYKTTSENSETELDLYQIVGTASKDDRYIVFAVYTDSVGNSGLYENEFDFRTPEGTPYNFSDIEFQVLTNNEEELEVSFTGKLKHYNQHDNEYIYLDIREGVARVKY